MRHRLSLKRPNGKPVMASQREMEFLNCFIGPGRISSADLCIAPDGRPYLYRWHLQKESWGCVFLHLQVGPDPDPWLHDHPWDNTSIILSGGYLEEVLISGNNPRRSRGLIKERNAGDIISRKATQMHRLQLKRHLTHSLSLFTTGAKRRDWGFLVKGEWVDFHDIEPHRKELSS